MTDKNNSQQDPQPDAAALARELVKARRGALAVLIFLLVSVLVWQNVDLPLAETTVGKYGFYTIILAGFGMASGIFVGATIWLGRLSKLRDDKDGD